MDVRTGALAGLLVVLLGAPAEAPATRRRVKPRVRVRAAEPRTTLLPDDSNSSYAALGIRPRLLPDGAPDWAEEAARRISSVVYEIQR